MGKDFLAHTFLISYQNTCLFLDWCDGLTVKKTSYFWTDRLTVKKRYFWTDGLIIKNMLFLNWWAECQKTRYFWPDGLTIKNLNFWPDGLTVKKTWYFWTDGLTVTKHVISELDGLANNGKPLRLGYWITMTSVQKYIHCVLVPTTITMEVNLR